MNDIALWGPTGSGKTSMLYAFGARMVEYENDPELMQNNYFSYQIYESGTRLLDFKSPRHVEATSEPSIINWDFVRRARQNEPKFRISSHYHRITMVDDRGLATVNMLSDPEAYRPTLENIAQASSVVILLDYTLLSDTQNNQAAAERSSEQQNDASNQNSSPSPKRTFSKKEYYLMIQQLAGIFKQYVKPRKIAVCFTKVDNLGAGFDQMEPERLIRSYFNTQTRNMLGLLNSLGDQSRTEIRYYCVSTRIRGDEDNWAPLNIEYPYFWILGSLEEEKITAAANKSLFGRLFLNQRLNYYIPYPQPKPR